MATIVNFSTTATADKFCFYDGGVGPRIRNNLPGAARTVRIKIDYYK